LAFTALVLAYVRNYVQYHRYSFVSVWEFLGFWFVHYVAVGLVGAVFYALLQSMENLVLGRADDRPPPSMDQAIVHFCTAILLASLAIFLIAHWPAGYSEGLDE